MRKGFIGELLVWEVIASNVLRDAGRERAFNGIPNQIIAAEKVAGLKKGTCLSDSHFGDLL
ncbi:MAG: hypothetical protein WAU45_05455 [Blastocatellia bacterium]